jgi:hypothetical protein
MRKFQELLDILKDLDLPSNNYAVFGSAPLVITGMIEDVNDFDIIIKPDYWPFGNKSEVRTGDFEFFQEWPNEDVDDLIDNNSFMYQGVRFIFPIKVIEYKRGMRRKKDLDLLEF